MQRVFIGIALIFLLGAESAPAEVRQFPASGSLQFVLHDDINLPFYSWPRTLLSYPVDFSAAHVQANQLSLVDSKGRLVPMQLDGVRQSPSGELQSATVCFFSDLKPGAMVSFTLSASGQSAVVSPMVHETSGDGVLEISGGSLSVRIPKSRRITAGEPSPAPIIALNRGGGWIGDNQLISPTRHVLRLATSTLASGPMFRAYQIRYDFAGGATYTAIVKIVAGYSFVDFSEEMHGLDPQDGARIEMNWTGFHPTHRFPAGFFDVTSGARWLGIDEPVITPDLEEDPKWIPANEIEDPATNMAFELAGYSGNGVRDATPVASFWENRAGGSELSVFALDTLKWQDHQYGIWQPSTRLQVHFRHEPSGKLVWTWPLVEGSRSTGIALDDAAAAQADTDRFVKLYTSAAAKIGGSSQVQDTRDLKLRSAQLLRSWYGTLSLDHVKDMVLNYPDTARQPPPMIDSGEIKTTKEFNYRMRTSALTLYPLGDNLVAMDIRHRELYDALIPAFNRLNDKLSSADKKRAVAMMLLSAYLNSTDDLCPVRICLGGCPNMSADGFSVPSEVTLLFPDHPMAARWHEQFEKTLRLMGCYYTRPAVPSWDSQGGRWTESLSVYNWAFFRPTEIAQFCAQSGDHQVRFANPWMAMRGRWMIDELTAPIYNPLPYWRQPKDPQSAFFPKPPPLSTDWKPGMPLSSDFGFDRQYPAHGAHGSGTSVLVPWETGYLGHLLLHYDPLTAEHLIWAARQVQSTDPGEMTSQGLWARQIIGSLPANSGTPPHFQSCKYTGHGVILRAGVGTPEELSIHLDQIDAGPNYRWGDNGLGANGVIYFFAQGKVWSGHERENTGDHYDEDTVGTTNFGFMKAGKYRDIGPGLLDQPLYDLSVAQFAQLKSQRGPGAYSWPQYDSRSILLVGTDYFLVLDRTAADPIPASGRFSWFQALDLPFPKLIFLKPLVARWDHWSEVRTETSHGILRDTTGSSLVLVTHKGDAVEMENMNFTPVSFIQSADMRTYSWRKGVKPIAGVWAVKAPASHDLVFIDDQPISCSLPTGESFTGSAGVIRHRDDGSTQLAIFHGSAIGTSDLSIEVPESDETGVSAVYTKSGEISGEYDSPHGASAMTLNFADPSQAGGSVAYLDGEKLNAKISGSTLMIPLIPGHHHWQFTAHLPRPMPANIVRTADFPGVATVYFNPSAGADSYQLQLSADGCKTWQPSVKSSGSPIRIEGLQANTKVHIRLIAANAEQVADPGDAYPLYVTSDPPAPPDGLYLHLSTNRVDASWGEVLGTGEYHLYRRTRGQSDAQWKLIYAGTGQSYSDQNAAGVVPPANLPGESSDASVIYEYAIATANGNGQGSLSAAVDTDPNSWHVWWPPNQPEQFKRQSAYWLPPYVSADQSPPARYPQ